MPANRLKKYYNINYTNRVYTKIPMMSNIGFSELKKAIVFFLFNYFYLTIERIPAAQPSFPSLKVIKTL